MNPVQLRNDGSGLIDCKSIPLFIGNSNAPATDIRGASIIYS